jgi:hypothetical protein
LLVLSDRIKETDPNQCSSPKTMEQNIMLFVDNCDGKSMKNLSNFTFFSPLKTRQNRLPSSYLPLI